MSNSNLYFNALTFDHAQAELTLYFTAHQKEGLTRVHISQVPEEVIEVLGDQKHYYTSFDQPFETALQVTMPTSPNYENFINDEGETKKKIVRNSSFKSSLLKTFYYYKLQAHFKSIGLLVHPNFINDMEVWIPSTEHKSGFDIYDRFSLKIQFKKISKHLELIVSYLGTSKVFSKSVSELQKLNVDPINFNWVVCQGNIYKFDEIPSDLLRDKTIIFPKWNFDIRAALNERPETPKRGNKYQIYKSKIDTFISTFFSNDNFQEIIPLHSLNLLKVGSDLTEEVKSKSNELVFGSKKTDRSPYMGMTNYGPFGTPIESQLHFFFIYYKPDKEKVKNLKSYLDDKLEVEYESYGRKITATFKGLKEFANLDPFYEEGTSFSFSNFDDPLPEIKQKLKKLNLPPDRQYMAIYVSPYDKIKSSKHHKSFYYKIKEHLLKKRISSQVIASKNIKANQNFTYSLNNIAVAIIAKLRGVPWKLESPIKKELVIGIGAYKHKDINVQYIGSAFSFQNTGELNYLDCYRKDQTKELAGAILQSVKTFRSYNQEIKKLIIHFYKAMSRKEIEPIEKGLKKLDLDIPVFILTINKTESRELVAFDMEHKDLLPESGQIINIKGNEFLLFNNTRYKNTDIRSMDGYPFPIKISIECTKKEELNKFTVKRELIDQVYQFSRMYWKSVRQQNLPVTIKYPEMVAEMFPYFEGYEIPDFGKDNLWFL